MANGESTPFAIGFFARFANYLEVDEFIGTRQKQRTARAVTTLSPNFKSRVILLCGTDPRHFLH